MIDVLVVDDDPAICQGFERMLRDIMRGGEVFWAENGLKALQIACSRNIGLIFTDIRMPVLDGLELLGKLSELGYRGEKVIISSFDDFQYTRQALRLGAADYLLKPLNAAELAGVYADCLKRLEERERAESGYTLSPDTLMSRILHEQLSLERFYQSEADFRAALEAGPDAHSAVLAVMNPFGRRGIQDSDRQSAFLQGCALVENCLEGTSYRTVQGESFGLWNLWVFCPPDKSGAVVAALREALAARRAGHGVSALLATSADTFEAARAQSERFFYDLAPAKGEEYPFPQATQELIERILAFDSAGTDAALDRLCALIAGARPGVGNAKHLLISLVYTLMDRNNDFIGVIGRRKCTSEDIVSTVYDAERLCEARDGFRRLMRLCAREVNQKSARQTPGAVERARERIKQGYALDLSASKVAEELGLHPNYLRTLFRQETGRTFGEYLRKVRIDKAIELMGETDLKVYEIGPMVGYHDSVQLFRAFKQETGTAPGKYRRQRMEKK